IHLEGVTHEVDREEPGRDVASSPEVVKECQTIRRLVEGRCPVTCRVHAEVPLGRLECANDGAPAVLGAGRTRASKFCEMTLRLDENDAGLLRWTENEADRIPVRLSPRPEAVLGWIGSLKTKALPEVRGDLRV